MVDAGRRVYQAACANCHGAILEGQPRWRDRLPNGRLPAPPHDVSGHTWHHPDTVLFQITKKGPAAYPEGYQTDMPAFAERLTDEDIAAVIAFIKSTWPEDILRRQLQTTARSPK
jgi:mono/diheme cytochrome c family protein